MKHGGAGRYLNQAARKGLSEHMAFEQRSEGSNGAVLHMWGFFPLGGGKEHCKPPRLEFPVVFEE